MHWIEVMQKVIGLGVVLTCKGIGLACLVLWSMKMLYTHKYDASQSVWTGQPPPFPVFWRHVSKQRKKTGWHNLHKVSNAQQKSSSLYTLGNLGYTLHCNPWIFTMTSKQWRNVMKCCQLPSSQIWIPVGMSLEVVTVSYCFSLLWLWDPLSMHAGWVPQGSALLSDQESHASLHSSRLRTGEFKNRSHAAESCSELLRLGRFPVESRVCCQMIWMSEP